MSRNASKNSLTCRVVARGYNSFPFPIHSIELLPSTRQMTILSVEFGVPQRLSHRLSGFLKIKESALADQNLRALATIEGEAYDESENPQGNILICRMQYSGEPFKSEGAAAGFMYHLGELLESPRLGLPRREKRSRHNDLLRQIPQSA